MLEGDTRDLGAQSPSPTWSASAARHAGFFVFIYGLFVWFRRCRRVPARGCWAPGGPVVGVNEVPVAQRIARRTSNPKVAGSIPARDGSVVNFLGRPGHRPNPTVLIPNPYSVLSLPVCRKRKETYCMSFIHFCLSPSIHSYPTYRSPASTAQSDQSAKSALGRRTSTKAADQEPQPQGVATRSEIRSHPIPIAPG